MILQFFISQQIYLMKLLVKKQNNGVNILIIVCSLKSYKMFLNGLPLCENSIGNQSYQIIFTTLLYFQEGQVNVKLKQGKFLNNCNKKYKNKLTYVFVL